MADVDVRVKLDLEEGDMKKAGNTFVNQLKTGLERSLTKFGVSGTTGEKGGSLAGVAIIGAAIQAGIAAVTAGLSLIVNALMDFPVVVAVMKILQLLLTILLLPLVPILKPVLLFLGVLAKALLPIMNVVSSAMTKLINGDIMDFVVDVLLKLPLKIIEGIWMVIKWLVGMLAKILDTMLTSVIGAVVWVANVLNKGFEWLANKFIDIVNAVLNFFHKGWGSIGQVDYGEIKAPIITLFQDTFSWISGWIDEGFSYLDGVLTSVASTFSDLNKQVTAVSNAMGTTTSSTTEKTASKSGGKYTNGAGFFSNLSEAEHIGKALEHGYSIVSLAPGVKTYTDSSGMLHISDPTGTYQTGGNIDEEGQYYLHRGERVVSSTEKGHETTGNITINISGPVIREEQDIKKLTTAISRELQLGRARYISYV